MSASNLIASSGAPTPLRGAPSDPPESGGPRQGELPIGGAEAPPVGADESPLVGDDEAPPLLDTRAYLATSLTGPDLHQETTPSEIETFPARLARYSQAARQRDRLLEWLAQARPEGSDRVRARLADCGQWLQFRRYLVSDQIRLHSACFCQQAKLCQFCALRYGARFLRLLIPKLLFVLESQPGIDPHLVTITVKNGPNLKERMAHLRRGLAVMHGRAKNRREKGRGKRSEFEAMDGRFRSIEIKRGSGGEWHPHAHILALCSRAPDQEALSAEWLEITGDSHIVDVRPFDLANVIGSLCEVVKYVTKFSEMEPADCWEVHRATFRRRLHESVGLLRLSQKDRAALEQLSDDPMDEPYIDLLYHYRGGEYELQQEHHQVDPVGHATWLASGFLVE